MEYIKINRADFYRLVSTKVLDGVHWSSRSKPDGTFEVAGLDDVRKAPDADSDMHILLNTKLDRRCFTYMTAKNGWDDVIDATLAKLKLDDLGLYADYHSQLHAATSFNFEQVKAAFGSEVFKEVAGGEVSDEALASAWMDAAATKSSLSS